MVNTERIIREFTALASIDSPSFQEGAIAHYLQQRFEALGAQVVFDDAGAAVGSQSGNLIARLPARGKSGEALLLSAHMDTVQPGEGVQPVLTDGVFRSAGDTILGADDKAGLTEILEALAVVQEENIPHGPIEIVVTICEEQGLMGAKALDLSQLSATRGLALDTCGVDCVTNRAPGANRLRIDIEGVESHAGIAPEKGISAIEVAARAIARMPLGRIDAETTANIGRIEGGVADNIVAKEVKIHAEARSHDAEKLARQTQAMVDAFEQAAEALARTIDGQRRRAQVRASVRPDYPIMAVAQDHPVMLLLQSAAADLGRPCQVMTGGGGSDANIFTGGGLPTVILGSGMAQVHSVHEQVTVADMVRVSELLVAILRRAWDVA